MLSKDATILVSLLSNRQDSLNQIYEQFQSSFDFEIRVKCLKGLSLLFSDEVLDHHQQINCFWILYKSFEVQSIDNHPFYSVFHYVYDFRHNRPNVYSPKLYELLCNCLNNNNLDFLSSNNSKSILSNNFSIPLCSQSDFSNPRNTIYHVSPLIIDRVNSDRDCVPHDHVLIQLLEDGSFYEEFTAPFLRPAPDICPIFEGELQQSYVLSFCNPPFLFDDNHSIDSRQAALSLLSRSCDNPLKEAERESLIVEINKDPRLCIDCNFSNERLLRMIEFNSSVASQVFCHLIDHQVGLSESLSRCDITPGVSEVILSLVQCHRVPSGFLESFYHSTQNSVRGIRDNQSISRIASPFCSLMIKVFKSGYKFEGNFILDLISFCIDLGPKNIKESTELSALLNSD